VNAEQLQELLEARSRLGLPSVALLEKDLQVVAAIRTVSEVDAAPFSLIFGGGTALARAHKAIARMSEDVDFKIIPPAEYGESRSRLKSQLRALRGLVTDALNTTGIFGIVEAHARNENRYIAYQLPYRSSQPTRGLRPSVQVELTYAPIRLPTVTRSVASFVTEAFAREPEVTAIACISITETAAEKLVALLRRTAMVLAATDDEQPYDDPTLVRHIYDLHCIQSRYDAVEVVDVARGIIRYDADVFANQFPAFRDDPMGEIRKAISALESDPIHTKRYQAFVKDMVYGDQVSFPIAFADVKRLAEMLYAA